MRGDGSRVNPQIEYLYSAQVQKMYRTIFHKKELLAGTLLGLMLGIVIFLTIPALRNLDMPNHLLPTTSNNPNGTSAKPGTTAPDFTLVDVHTDQPVSLSNFTGRPVILNFWATWCGPCKIEMPHLQDVHNNYHNSGVTILAINSGEDPNTVLDFASELNLTFPILVDNMGAVQQLYQIRGFPSTIFIYKDGTVAHNHIGMLSEEILSQRIEQISLVIDN